MSNQMALMMLASIGSKTLMTKTFTGSETWPVPAGVTRLESVTGKGEDGAAQSQASAGTVGVSFVAYSSSGTGNNAGVLQWATANSYANNARSAVNTGGSGTYKLGQMNQYPSSYNLQESILSFSNAVPGSAVLAFDSGWRTSGSITNSGQATMSWNVYVAATSGRNASGFGLTFPGGTAGPATPQNFGPQTVTPGASMSIVVPSASAYITITYYA